MFDKTITLCGFQPGHKILDNLFILLISEDEWQFAQLVYMCLVELEKEFHYVSQGVWGVCFGSVGYQPHSYGLFSSCTTVVRF